MYADGFDPKYEYLLNALHELCILVPCAIAIFKCLLPRATFKLVLLHFAALYLLASPLVLHTVASLALTCLVASITLLLYNCPLLATVPMALAVNLDLACLPLLPVFLVYAVSNIILNSPSAYVVKQVDYIVWRVFFLCFNFLGVMAPIWWNLITKPGTNKLDTSEAKLLLVKLLPLNGQLQLHSVPFFVQAALIIAGTLPSLYFLAKVPNAKQLLMACFAVSALVFVVGF